MSRRNTNLIALILAWPLSAWAADTDTNEQLMLAERVYLALNYEHSIEHVTEQYYRDERSPTKKNEAVIIATYQRKVSELIASTYTTEEMGALLHLYESDVGQRIIAKNLQIMKQMGRVIHESLQAGSVP